MAVQLREMTLADYDEVYALWAASEGIGLSSADSREWQLARFCSATRGWLLWRLEGMSSLAPSSVERMTPRLPPPPGCALVPQTTGNWQTSGASLPGPPARTGD